MTIVSAYAATSATAPLSKTTIKRRDVGPHDVAFDIHFAGICHSDIHTVRGEWGTPAYPVVPGHEIAGIVTAIGSDVTKYKVGDRVGVGCFVDSCRECSSCLAGDEQYCKRGMIGTYNAVGRDGQPTQGGYSGAIVVDENYVLRIPDSMPLEAAAPLLCAGITTVLAAAALERRTGQAGRVLSGSAGSATWRVKLANAMGANVTVLSQSLKKMEDGLRLGARDYYATADPETFTKLAGSFDLILNTVSANLDLGRPSTCSTSTARWSSLGMPEHPMHFPAFPLVSDAAQPVRLDDRRHRRNPGDAGFLRRARRCVRDRSHRTGLHQRGLRAGAGQ